MASIGSLADRLLRTVVPQVKAEGSCCQYQTYSYPCYCSGGYWYYKTCWTNCCQSGCYPCYKTGKTCA